MFPYVIIKVENTKLRMEELLIYLESEDNKKYPLLWVRWKKGWYVLLIKFELIFMTGYLHIVSTDSVFLIVISLNGNWLLTWEKKTGLTSCGLYHSAAFIHQQ